MKVDSLPGARVTIKVGGQVLKEYEDNSDELYIPNFGRCYVEASSGAEFEIGLAFDYASINAPSPLDSLVCRVYLDGTDTTSRVLDIQGNGYRRGCLIDGRPENSAADDGPAKSIKPETVVELGEVRVDFFWFRNAGAAVPCQTLPDFKPTIEGGLPEKCLKGRAVSHSAKLGERKACTVIQNTQHGSYPYSGKPFAKYTFKYRSKRDLQIEGVLPRTPSPVPLEERDPDSLTAEEARELVRQMRAIQKDNVQVKREKRERSSTALEDDDDEDDARASSESRGRKRQRRSTDSAIDVVDLTDD
ncbi:hypothetical protein LTR10_007830 [Elasticomyces elasticus]|nr:hypothetical protein LTR10_007830 [Elasticomyces elasticus]KAK4970830.1 hypothetical protein LTR42_007807 [Elasticomyces elasticus]